MSKNGKKQGGIILKKYNKIIGLLLAVALLLPGMATKVSAAENDVTRLAGADRVETSIKISQDAYANGSATEVVLAGWEGKADALTGTYLASAKKAPLLFTKDSVTPNLLAELKRLGAKTVYVLGGTAVVKDSVVTALQAEGMTVERVKGDNRFETAEAVAKKINANPKHVFLAYGWGELPDALAAGPASAKEGIPVLLTQNKVEETAKVLKDLKVEKVTILGGESAVSKALADRLVTDLGVANVNRVSGLNRFETANAIAAKYFAGATKAIVANSNPDNNPDALVAGYFGAMKNAPILLTPATALHDTTATYLKDYVKEAYIVGGTAAVNATVETAVKTAITPVDLAVVSVSAINGAQVEVKFNQTVDKATVFTSGLNNSAIILANFAFTGIDGTAPTAPTGKLSADGKTLVITANDNSYEDRFRVVINNVKTEDGKNIIKYDQIVNLGKDTVAPTVLGVEKLTSNTFKVKFSEPMKTLGTPSYKLADGTVVSTVTSDFAGGKQDVVFTLGTGINAGDVVTATFVGAQDQASNLINPNPTSVTFTKGDKDGVRPEVSSVTPKGLNKFEIKFSEEVQNLLVGNIYVDGVALTAFSTPNGTTITRDALDKTKYEVELAGTTVLTAGLHKIEVRDTGAPATSVTDLSGEKLKDFSQILDFKADTLAPKFISSAVVVDAATQKEKLVLTFDKEVAQPAVFSTIVATELTKEFVTTTGVLNAGQLTVNANNKKQLEVVLDTVKFNGASSASLAKDATYTVNFPKAYVKGINTVDVEAFNITFKRGQDGTVTVDAPTVSSVTAATNDTITVLFDKTLDGATATNAANYTIPGLVIEKAELSLDTSVAKKVTLILAKGTNKENGSRNLTIKNVKAKDGKVMDTVTKLVKDMKENVAPTIQSAKFTGVTGGSVDKITLTFTEAIKATDNNTTIFEIYVGDSTTALPVTNVDFSGNTDNKVELTVTTALTTAQIEKGITVKVKTANEVVDLNGNKLDFTSIKATY